LSEIRLGLVGVWDFWVKVFFLGWKFEVDKIWDAKIKKHVKLKI
jgi:hypothetical protein